MSNRAKKIQDVLEDLGIRDGHSGAWCTSWYGTTGPALPSFDPSSGQQLATVNTAEARDYEAVAAATAAAFKQWRTWPAPQRGEVVRKLGLALREHKESLGQLVSLEVGKIASEGLGEVQEMIDMADLAVGMSKAALRQDDALGATEAPHVRAMAPSRTGRHYHGVQLPCGRLGLERNGGSSLRQFDDLEAVAQVSAHRNRRHTNRCPRARRVRRAADLRPGHRAPIARSARP